MSVSTPCDVVGTCKTCVVPDDVPSAIDRTTAADAGLEQNGHSPAHLAHLAHSAYHESAEPIRPDLIRCWWTHISSGGHGVSRILPDNCADLIVRDDGVAWLVGAATTADVFATSGPSTLRAIRIAPVALGVVTGLDAAEIVDRRVGFDDVFARSLSTALAEAIWLDDRAAVRRLLADSEGDRALAEGYRILERRPGADIDLVAEHAGHSARNFRRLMRRSTGLAPKLIQRVSRFRSFVDAAEGAGRARSLAELACEAGYADQAHLTRECSSLSGLAPRALLAERRLAAAAAADAADVVGPESLTTVPAPPG